MTFTLSDDDILRCRSIALGDNELIMDIVRAVSKETGIPVALLQGVRKYRPIVQARWLICYLAHVEAGFGVEAIARVLRKDHSSVCYGVRMERERRESEGRAE
jgi:chromosomal replication initiation ATPase DnaA